MSVPALVVLVCYALVVAFWKLLHVVLFFYKPARFFLPASAEQLASDEGPLVSILLAARNEEADIEACVRSVLQSEYRNFELIVLDDRSTDGTALAAERVAAEDSRVRVQRVQELPAGWTGKMNAVRQGLASARGEIVLLVDADTRHTPRTLGVALGLFQERDLQLLSLIPSFDNPSFLLKLLHPLLAFLLFIWKPLPLVNSRRRKRMAMCWGGFLMMRRKTLEAAGGLEAIQGRIAADIALFRHFKQCGHRTRLLHAPELVSTYMYHSLGEMVEGWSRIVRVTVEGRVSLLVATFLGVLLLSLSAYPAAGVGLVELLRGQEGFFPLMLGMMGLGHLVFHIAFLARVYRFGGMNPLYALGHLPATVFACFLLVLTMFRCRSRKMLWRGTDYQLNMADQPCSI
jgi:cellulose synthase/poly-beta-1,6-N-acetylglucosamine synthase-like glycosyltransferase